MNDYLKRLRDNVDPLLTNLVQGASNENFVSSLLYPEIMVDDETGKYPVFGNDAFIPRDGQRALRQEDVPEVELGDYTTESFTTEEHALSVKMDYREVKNSKQFLDLEANRADVLMQSLMLSKEYDRCRILQDASSYGGNAATISVATDKWTHEDSKPITQIRTGVNAIREKNIKPPNICIIGLPAFRALQDHPDILNRMSDSGDKIVTEDVLSKFFSTNQYQLKVVVGTGRYNDPAAPTVYKDLWEDSVVLAYVSPTKSAARSMYESTFAYSFRLKGFPFTSRVTGKHNLTTEIAVLDFYRDAIVKPTAGYLIKDIC